MNALPGLPIGPSIAGVGTWARAVAATSAAPSRVRTRDGRQMDMQILLRRRYRGSRATFNGRPLDRTTRHGVECAMPYAEGRRFFDADSHLMETPEWLHYDAHLAIAGRL